MPKKIDKYQNERQNVINRVFEILGINERNNMFGLHELDNNKEKQDQILALEPDIKKYFLCGTWTYFKYDDNIKRRPLSLIKSLMKDMNYNITSTRKTQNAEVLTMYCITKNIF